MTVTQVKEQVHQHFGKKTLKSQGKYPKAA
jgi:hypothetical protein